MDVFALTLLNGIAFGTVLFLVASGLSLVLGVMGILNLAHGALYMVGAFVGWTVAIRYGLNFWLAVLAGGLTAGLVGLVLELRFLRHLHKQFNEQVLLTVGFIYILTNLSLWIWGGNPRAPFTAPFLHGSLKIFGSPYPIARIAIIIIGILVVIFLWWLLEKTRTGSIVRAGMDHKDMTLGLGINYTLVASAVFCLGAFMAGCAGVIGAQFLGATLNLSTDVLLLALAVVVIGGMGSVQGTLLGGVLIGIVDAFSKALLPGIAMYAPYIAMITILLVKPSGLLGRKG
jgi:branched-chain amino acid transport system permease protein